MSPGCQDHVSTSSRSPMGLQQDILETMGWIIAAAVLLVPFVLFSYHPHPAARIGLLLFWLVCGAASACCFFGAGQLNRELQTSQRYELPASPGRHSIELTPLPQMSMKGVLHGGAGTVPRATLEKLKWSFSEKVPVTWFIVKEYDEPDPGDTLLFYVDWPSGPPYRLEYEVEEGLMDALRQRALVVTYDRSARHILAEGLVVIRLLAWASCLWGGLWMVVQARQEWTRRRQVRLASPAGG